MILTADSGSTKTDWCLSDGKIQQQFRTGGANPFFRSTPDLVQEWKASEVNRLREKVTQVYFYGAGVVNDEKAAIIRQALLLFFPDAIISVQSDLLAAARATLGSKAGIACILGTGSNSCLYNGNHITAHVPPLGFILGDEGSGAMLGRQLIGDYLKKIMPDVLSKRFKERYPMEYTEFLNRVYRHEKPNEFLAGFVPFLKEHREHSYCKTLVEEAFELFIERNVARYEHYQEQSLCFAGSIAFHFQEQLKAVCTKRNLRLGEIIQAPLLHLTKYHLQHHENEQHH